MNGHDSKPLEFETFNPIEFDGVKTGDRQCTSNYGEFAIIGSGMPASNPVEFHGAESSPPTPQHHEQCRP